MYGLCVQLHTCWQVPRSDLPYRSPFVCNSIHADWCLALTCRAMPLLQEDEAEQAAGQGDAAGPTRSRRSTGSQQAAGGRAHSTGSAGTSTRSRAAACN